MALEFAAGCWREVRYAAFGPERPNPRCRAEGPARAGPLYASMNGAVREMGRGRALGWALYENRSLVFDAAAAATRSRCGIVKVAPGPAHAGAPRGAQLRQLGRKVSTDGAPTSKTLS